MGFPLNLLLLLTLCSQAQAGRIYGGRVAAPHSRPYMALLERVNDKDVRIRHCDGFLLGQDFVMTAAHCNARSLIVRLGVHNVLNGSQQVLYVKEVYPHPEYEDGYLDYDIMLLKLSEKAVFTNYVKPIPLPRSEDEVMPEACLVSGWGHTNRNGGHGSNLLREVNVTVVHNETCAAYRLLCTAGENGPGPGDSGGPLVCGDLSFGVVAHMEGSITSYTRITDYLPWIQETMKSPLSKDEQDD